MWAMERTSGPAALLLSRDPLHPPNLRWSAEGSGHPLRDGVALEVRPNEAERLVARRHGQSCVVIEEGRALAPVSVPGHEVDCFAVVGRHVVVAAFDATAGDTLLRAWDPAGRRWLPGDARIERGRVIAIASAGGRWTYALTREGDFACHGWASVPKEDEREAAWENRFAMFGMAGPVTGTAWVLPVGEGAAVVHNIDDDRARLWATGPHRDPASIRLEARVLDAALDPVRERVVMAVSSITAGRRLIACAIPEAGQGHAAPDDLGVTDVRRVIALPDGRLLTGSDAGIHLWDGDAEPQPLFGAGHWNLDSLGCGHGWIYSGDRTGRLAAAPVEGSERGRPRVVRAHRDGVGMLAPLAPGRVASGAEGSLELRVWDLRDASVTTESPVADPNILALVQDPPGDLTILTTHAVHVWPAGSDRPETRELEGLPGRGPHQEISPGEPAAASTRDGRLVAVTRGGHVIVVDPATGAVAAHAKPTRTSPRAASVCRLPDGRFVIALDGRLFRAEVADGIELERWMDLPAPVRALAAAEGRVLCVVGEQAGSTHALSVPVSEAPSVPWRLDAAIRHIATGDGAVAVATGDRTAARRVRVARLPDLDQEPDFHEWDPWGDEWQDRHIKDLAFLGGEHVLCAGTSSLVLAESGLDSAAAAIGSLRTPGGPTAVAPADDGWWELAVGPTIDRLTRWRIRPSSTSRDPRRERMSR